MKGRAAVWRRRMGREVALRQERSPSPSSPSRQSSRRAGNRARRRKHLHEHFVSSGSALEKWEKQDAPSTGRSFSAESIALWFTATAARVFPLPFFPPTISPCVPTATSASETMLVGKSTVGGGGGSLAGGGGGGSADDKLEGTVSREASALLFLAFFFGFSSSLTASTACSKSMSEDDGST